MKILTIQHAGNLGGSCISLLYTIEGLRALGHECVVALARPCDEVAGLYEQAGFPVVRWPLRCWDHSTVAARPLWNPLNVLELFKVGWDWNHTGRRTLELVAQVRPDVVHLNSMPLSPSAAALAQAGFPFVWHVREPPPDQSWRTRRIRAILRRAPARIFLSEYDRQAWMGAPDGEVIHNFVDQRFFAAGIDGPAVRRELGIAPEAFVVLYLGGPVAVKGYGLLLEALAEVRRTHPGVVAIMPGTQWQPARSTAGKIARRVLPLFGTGLPIQRFEARMRELGLEDALVRIPYERKVERLFAASDVLVFPAVAPHFARPVIEAAAMGKPAIGTDLGGVNELIVDQQTGLLTRPGSAGALAAALAALATEPARRHKLGASAQAHASARFVAARQVAQIAHVLSSSASR